MYVTRISDYDKAQKRIRSLFASSVGRIPKNAPLARFLYGIPPHRFESHVVGNKKTTERLTRSLVYDGADNGIRTRDPHLGKVMLYQLSHVRMSKNQFKRKMNRRKIKLIVVN